MQQDKRLAFAVALVSKFHAGYFTSPSITAPYAWKIQVLAIVNIDKAKSK